MRFLFFYFAILFCSLLALSAEDTNAFPEKPNAENTGTTGALISSGSMTITTDGAIIENLSVSGRITVDADNVIIRNCLINGGSFSDSTGSFYCILANRGGKNLLIEDCELRSARSSCILGSDFTIRRSHLWDSGGDAIKANNNVLVESCFIEKLGFIATSHADGLQMTSGSNVTVRGNTFNMPDIPGYNNSINLIIQTNNSPIDNITIECNWLNGGGWTIQIRDKGNGHGAPTNVRIIDNLFGRDAQFGPWITDGDDTIISGNRWEDTLELLPGQTSSTTDTEAPTVPTNLAFSNSVLSWAASTDNIAVANYRIFQDGVFLKTSATTATSIAGLASATTYIFTLSAVDSADNESAQSSPLSVTTAEAPTLPNLPDSLIAHWTFDGNAIDLVGNREANLSGPTFNPTGSISGALTFDSPNDRAEVSTFNIPENQLTLACWVYPTSFAGDADEARFISKASSTSTANHDWMLGNHSDGTAIRFRLKINGTTQTLISGDNQITLNTWNHIAATYDGTTMKVFSNGVEAGSLIQPGTITDSDKKIGLGNQPISAGQRPLIGHLDDVRIYSTALTALELQAVMNPTPFDLWKQNHYNTPDDHDNISLLEEYAFDLDPTTFSNSPVTFDGSTLTFPTPRAELTYEAEYSTNFSTWTTTNPGGDRVFARVRISQ